MLYWILFVLLSKVFEKKRVYLLVIYLFIYIFRNNIFVKNGIFLYDFCIDWYYRIYFIKDKEILWKYYNVIVFGGGGGFENFKI